MKIYQGSFEGKNLKIAIIISRFNETITKNLLSGSLDCLLRHGVLEENISVVWVPGGFEIPLAAKCLASSELQDAIICLGAIIKGSTPHFGYVSSQVASGIASVSLETNIPIIFGVLTTNTIEEAIERSGTKSGNKGFDAALSAIEMANLMHQLAADEDRTSNCTKRGSEIYTAFKDKI